MWWQGILELFSILLGLIEVVAFGAELFRYWRISVSIAGSLVVVVMLAIVMNSQEWVWVLGFHIVLMGLIVGVYWTHKEKSDPERESGDK